jgi:AcrR family transcriptional regulator
MAAVKESEARVYGGRTGDERAAERRAALLEAAFALVAQDGWRALRIDAVCRSAGLNKRYFYESFAGVDELIAGVTERLAGEAIDVTLGSIEDVEGPDARVRVAITAFVSHLTDDPRRARVLFGALPAGEDAARHRVSALRRVIDTVAAEGRAMHGVQDEAFIEATASMLVGGTSQAVLDWLDGRIGSSRDALAENLVSLWQAIGDLAAARG